MKKSFRHFFRDSGRGLLRGAGGAAVAAIGWKIASDVYDAVKARLKNRQSPDGPAGEQDPPAAGSRR